MLKYAGKNIKIEYFPNNEIRIRDIEYKKNALIEFKYESSDDIIALIFLKNSIDDKGYNADLYIRYMPYSRMDREFERDLFLLKYMADIINKLKFRNIYVLEPHSNATIKLLKNVVTIRPMKALINKVKEDVGFDENDYIVFPDEGAYDRYRESEYKNTLRFKKKRDESSTKIKELYLDNGRVNKGSKCIIIDDICASGNTVLKVAKILKEKGAKDIYVLVVHTENQAIDNPILAIDSPVDKIYTTNSLITRRHKKVKIIPFKIEEQINGEKYV